MYATTCNRERDSCGVGLGSDYGDPDRASDQQKPLVEREPTLTRSSKVNATVSPTFVRATSTPSAESAGVRGTSTMSTSAETRMRSSMIKSNVLSSASCRRWSSSIG